MLLPLLLAAAIGYVLGALPFGYVVARAKGINIFEHGSKNPGATNVKRVLGEKFGPAGKRLGNLVFALDVLKGAAAAGWPLVYFWLSLRAHPAAPAAVVDGAGQSAVWAQIAGLVGAVLGHSFSCFTGFRGGKGVATAAGGLVVLVPLACLTAGAVWVVAFYASRYVSLASILAAAAIAAASWAFRYPLALSVVATAVGLFVVVRHRTNIQRLLAGTENKFVKKPKEPAA